MLSALEFPVSTHALSDWLPHRGPAVWVDQVSWVEPDCGECEVRLSRDANYVDDSGRLRPSSFIEWMAQSFGYVAACQMILGLGSYPERKKPEQVFLVQVRDFELVGEPNLLVRDGVRLRIRVRRTHQLGPVTLVDGEVREDDQTLARAKLKLFAS